MGAGIFLSQQENLALVRAYADEEGLIQYDVFGEALREGMSDRRKTLVRKIYQKVTRDAGDSDDECGRAKVGGAKMTLMTLMTLMTVIAVTVMTVIT